MSARFTLPQATGGDHESARRRLGGRASSAEGTGRLVRVTHTDGADPLVGVVVFVDPGVWHVWLGAGRVLKTHRVEELTGPISESLARVAAAARDFAAIEEGDDVAFREREGRLVSGTVYEKCRYGALVLQPDGKLLAIGFARLRRKSPPHTNSN